MLDNKSINKAITNGQISIFVSFASKKKEIQLLDSELDILSSDFKENLYSDRLKLTMGPRVKVLNKYVKPKCRFKASKEHYDLRCTNNTYTINPGESIIVLTNERIKLDGKHACLIIPRISLSDVGLVVTTAYIDPYYDGILRLHVTNSSNKVHQLKTLEVIAQCFFFELSDESSNKFKEAFASKSVFLGQTWSEIINSDRPPFPTKKNYVTNEKFSNIKYQFGLLWLLIKKYSILGILFANIIVFASGYGAIKENFTQYTMFANQMQEMLSPVTSEIIITQGSMFGKKEIMIECEKSEIISILCNNNEINYKILSGDTKDHTKIIFSTQLNSPATEEYTITFTYTILRRVEK